MNSEIRFTAASSPGQREKEAVRALEAVCNAADGTQFETYLSNQFNAHPEMDAFFFAWQEDDLAGVLSLYADEEDEAEVTALVRPDARGQGLFTALLGRALAALAPYGTEKLTFKTDAAFPAGAALAVALGGQLRSQEYLMAARTDGPAPAGAGLPGLEVGPARPEELAALTDIEQEAFGGSRDEAARYVEGTFAGQDQLLLAARLAGAPVGMASVETAGRWAYLYGVCVAAAHRGRGIGTGLLRGALAVLPSITPKRPALSVEADNAAALRLYTHAGFEQLGCQRYYTASAAHLRQGCGAAAKDHR